MSQYQTTFSKNESWQIDYIEGEITEDQRTDMDLLLEHSQPDRDAVDNLSLLKETIKGSEGDTLPKDEKYWQDFHEKIMLAVEGSSPTKWKKEKVPTKWKGARR